MLTTAFFFSHSKHHIGKRKTLNSAPKLWGEGQLGLYYVAQIRIYSILDCDPITEPLSIFRHMKRRWLKSLLNVMLGTISFTSIDLPPTTASDNVFRLWGLTMGMTKDIIKLVDTKESFFYKLTTQSPRFSRVDIGWFTMLITYAKVYWKRICHKNVR